ncbi:hypothetical protein N9A89_00905 [Akkermansiaceae bacterium]|nr:hypothetical protein [Akkermansiaceae bacterium]MDB4562072.1 hypothetical protein [Akkermansiaceae bacterium]MDB4585666.1 hypothetical protein [Akkermansiaceae bacterium]
MSEAQGAGRPRRFRRWLLRIILVPLILLGLGNLFLATPWGTGLVERQIEKRFSLPCEIGSISWTPWGGGKIHAFEVALPDSGGEEISLATIDEVVIDPSWLSMLKGRKRFERVEVRGLEFDLAVESLKSLLKSRGATVPIVSEQVPSTEKKKNVPTIAPKTSEKETPKQDPVARPSPRKPERPDIVPIDDFEGSLVLHDVKVRLYSRSVPQAEVAFEDLSGEIPLWGKERSGQLDFEGLRIGSDGSREALTLPIKWSDGFLKITEPELHVLGLHFNLDAALGFAAGLPFGIHLKVPQQRVNFTSLRENAPPVDIARFSSDNLLRGSLLHPMFSSGTSETVFENCVIRDPSDGSMLAFQYGGNTLTLSSAGLFVNDFRLIGEEEAFLGNGFLTTSGIGAATLRVIASPNRAETFEKRVLHANPDWTLALRPLVTPDRWHRDLRFDPGEQGLTVDIGRDGKAVALSEVVSRVRQGHRVPSPSLVP